MFNKGKKRQISKDKRVLLASVDVGSTVHYGYWRCGRAESTILSFRNSSAGFRKFWHWLQRGRIQQGTDEIVVGIESTGSYGEPLLHYLSEQASVRLVQVNPMHTKRVKELEGNSPHKTDRKDPKVIADIMELGHVLSVIIPRGTSAELRQLSHYREQLLRKRTSASNQLYGVLAKFFPEFVKIMKGVKSKSALSLLSSYPRPEDICSLSVASLTAHLKRVSRGQLGEVRARALYDAAKHSIGITEGSFSLCLSLRCLVEEVQFYNERLTEAERQMRRYLAAIPFSRYLLSIPGVGDIIAAVVIGETGDVRSFHSSDALLKLAGLNLFEVSSGKHRGARHITKRGRALLRTALYFAAVSSVRTDINMREYYQRLTGRGMKKIKALIAVSRKLLRIMYAVVRDERNYDAAYSTVKAA